MSNAIDTGESGSLLKFNGKMTYEFASEIEEVMLDAMRHYPHVEVDLSKVDEIDGCGIHLLGFLENFSAKGLHIIASSRAVEEAYERLHRRVNGKTTPSSGQTVPGLAGVGRAA
jgi:anti-anti-sigma regulatory factor